MKTLLATVVALATSLAGNVAVSETAIPMTKSHVDAAETIELNTLGVVRVAVTDLAATKEMLQSEMGFQLWGLGPRLNGEESVTIVLKTGQTIEFVTQTPFYDSEKVNGAKGVGLAFGVDSIVVTALALLETGVSVSDIVPIHPGFDVKRPKMFDFVFMQSKEFPESQISFFEKYPDGIKAVEQESPEYDLRQWQTHDNSATALREVWMAVDDIQSNETALAGLGFVSVETLTSAGHRVYQIGDVRLNLVSPQNPEHGKLYEDKIAMNGQGLFRIVLEAADEGPMRKGTLPGSSVELELR